MIAHSSISHRGPEVISKMRAAFIDHFQCAQTLGNIGELHIFVYRTLHGMYYLRECRWVFLNRISGGKLKALFRVKNIVYIYIYSVSFLEV